MYRRYIFLTIQMTVCDTENWIILHDCPQGMLPSYRITQHSIYVTDFPAGLPLTNRYGFVVGDWKTDKNQFGAVIFEIIEMFSHVDSVEFSHNGNHSAFSRKASESLKKLFQLCSSDIKPPHKQMHFLFRQQLSTNLYFFYWLILSLSE